MMEIAELNGIKIHWREDGAGAGAPALVFANSLGTDLRLWDPILPHLPPQYRIIRWDKRGHGLSACPPAPYRIEDLAADAEALLDHLGLRRVIFVGLSIGGMIGQALAARRPDLVRALVLSNTAPKLGTPELWQERISAIRAGGLESIADSVMARWFHPDFQAKPALALWRTLLARMPAEGYIGCAEAIAAADLTQSTARLRLPVLGISGEGDVTSPPELVRAAIAPIPGSRAVILPRTGHLPCIEAPEAYAACLTAFFKELPDA